MQGEPREVLTNPLTQRQKLSKQEVQQITVWANNATQCDCYNKILRDEKNSVCKQ